MIVCDTGPLVAAADRDDHDNRACTDLLTALHLAHRPILVPAPVVAEVGYLLGTTDATVIAVAERLHITEIATLDRRHFHAVRPRHTNAFTLLPG